MRKSWPRMRAVQELPSSDSGNAGVEGARRAPFQKSGSAPAEFRALLDRATEASTGLSVISAVPVSKEVLAGVGAGFLPVSANS